MELKCTVQNEQNLKQILKERFGISDNLLTKLKKNQKIYLNNKSNIYLDIPIKPKDEVRISLDFEEDNTNIIPTKIPLNILYEDEGLIILNKPPYLPVHPSLNHYENSLSNGVKYYYDSINLKRKIRPINRLDKDTSGIVVFAKNEYIQYRLQNYSKEYIVVVTGELTGKGVINKPIARKSSSIIERCIDVNGDNAVTEYEVIKSFEIENQKLSLVKCVLHTGRTHQIRVHMNHIGHPILGDTLYGEESHLINRQALHAYKINFIHPLTRKNIKIVANIPNDIVSLLNFM